MDPDDGGRPPKSSLQGKGRPGRELRSGRKRETPPRRLGKAGPAEVAGTVVGDPGARPDQGSARRPLQGPLLSGRQVLFQLLQAGHAQDDRVPVGALQGGDGQASRTDAPQETPSTHTPASPAPAKAWGGADSCPA